MKRRWRQLSVAETGEASGRFLSISLSTGGRGWAKRQAGAGVGVGGPSAQSLLSGPGAATSPDRVFLCFQNVKHRVGNQLVAPSLLMSSYKPAEAHKVPLSPLVSRRGYACGTGSQAGLASHTLSLFNAQEAPL